MVGGAAAAAPGFALSKFEANLVHASVPRIVRADQGPVRVSVRTRTTVSGLIVQVNGSRHSAIQIVRRSALRWRVILPRRVLDGGLNAVTVVARARGHWGAAFPQFQYLFPRHGLVRVLSPRPGAKARGVISQTFALARGASVRAWLNGRSEAAQVHPANAVLVHGQLRLHFVAGIPFGVHFGKNRLVVMATRGRFYTRIVRVVRVINGGLLLGGTGGTPTVTASAPLVQVQTQVNGGVIVGGTVYPDPDANHDDAAEVFVFDLRTLALIASRAFSDLTPIDAWILQQEQQEADPIVIVQTAGRGAQTQEFAPLDATLEEIGAAPLPAPDLNPPNYFVAIGGPGLPPGTATESCIQEPPAISQTRCAISGYFFSPVGPSVTGNYIFEPGADEHFALKPTPAGQGLSNTITVEGFPPIVAPPFPAGSNGGYHVVVLDRYTLGVVSNQVFATGDPAPGGEEEMLADLNSVVNDPDEMVLMTSVGQPLPSGDNPDPAAANGILAAINKLGGTPDLFARATGNQTYSLVGIAGNLDYGAVAEASSDAPAPGETSPPPGAIDGVLSRGIRNYAFEPYLTSPTQVNGDVFSAIYRPATAWPDSTDPGSAAASAYIAGQLFPGASPAVTDARDEYDNLNLNFAARESLLSGIQYPQQAGFPQAY